MISSFEDYNHKILRKLQENKLKSIANYPQPFIFNEPDSLFGGIRFLSDHPLPSGVSDRNLATGGKSISKTFKKLVKDTGKTLLKDAPSMVSKTVEHTVVPALSKYGEKALTNYLSPAVEAVAENAVPMALGMGRKKRSKKPKYESESDEEKEGGKFNLGKTLKKGLSMAEKYAPKLAETAAMTVAENPELLLALGRKKGGKRPVKGSPEAIAWGKKMKEAKEAKKK